MADGISLKGYILPLPSAKVGGFSGVGDLKIF